MRRKYRKLMVWGIVLVVLVAVGMTFPTWWGPAVAVSIARATLPQGEGAENEIEIHRIGISGLEVGKIRIAGLPAAPSIDGATVKYTVFGLLRRRIDSVTVKGAYIEPEYLPPETVGQMATAGARDIPADPLQGWSVGHIDVETAKIDFSKALTKDIAAFFPFKNAEAKLDVNYAGGIYSGRIEGDLFGGKLTGTMGYSQNERSGGISVHYQPEVMVGKSFFQSDVTGDFDFAITSDKVYGISMTGRLDVAESDVYGDVSISASQRGVSVQAKIPQKDVTEKDSVVAAVVNLFKLPDTITDLTASGQVAGSFNLAYTNNLPVWNFTAGVTNITFGAKIAGNPLEAFGGRTRISIDGIASHFDINPIPVSITNGTFSSLSFGRGRAVFMASEKDVLAPEISVDFCGGKVKIYSLYCNIAKMSTGFTVFLDSISIGELIKFVPQLETGEATGVVYGRLPMGISDNGKRLWLGDAFIYSEPGKVGNIRLVDTSFISSYLPSFGVTNAQCEYLEKVLKNLDYTILRLDMSNPKDENGQISIRIDGESRFENKIQPVQIKLNFIAPIQRELNKLINMLQ